MKSIYVRNLLRSFVKKRLLIIVGFIIFVLLFGALGLRQAYPGKVSDSLEQEIEEYNNALNQYEEAISNTKENIEITQTQVDTQQNYCDESIFMQIDSTNVQMASVQYMVRISDMTSTTASSQISYIINAWTTYINNGSMRSELADELGYSSTVYLSELISCNTSGNILTLTVKHYDMQQAKEILQKLEQRIEEYRPEIEESLGSFDMQVIDLSELALSDINVQNTQNNNINNLRNYKNILADLETKLVTQQTQKNTYEQQYKPTGVNTTSPKKTLLEYGALGVLAGIIIPFVIYALYYTISGRVKSKEELLAAELNILASYHPKKGYTPSADRAAVDIELLAKQSGATRVCLNVLGESTLLKQVEQDVTQLLTDRNLEVMTVEAGTADSDQVQRMAEANNCVLLIETGRTSYSELEEQIQFCRRFNIPVWGCVVIE